MNKEILRLAIPNILSNIYVPQISSFDTVLIGNLGGTHIAAVGLEVILELASDLGLPWEEL